MENSNVTCQTGVEQVSIVTDFALWDALFQGRHLKRPHKLSKAEAFYDLVNRHRLAIITGDSNYINCGILTLAQSWGWQRQTVDAFLVNLQKIGVLSVDSDGYRKIPRLTLYRRSDEKKSSKDGIYLSDDVFRRI